MSSGLPSVLHGRPTQRQAERLENHVVVMGEDKVVTHEQVEVLFEVRRADDYGRYQGLVQKARKLLADNHSIRLESERGIGYRYLTGDAQLKSGVKTVRRGAKTIHRGFKACAIVPDKRLTAKGIEIRDQAVGAAKVLAAIARSTTKTLQLTVGKTDANPTGKPS